MPSLESIAPWRDSVSPAALVSGPRRLLAIAAQVEVRLGRHALGGRGSRELAAGGRHPEAVPVAALPFHLVRERGNPCLGRGGARLRGDQSLLQRSQQLVRVAVHRGRGRQPVLGLGRSAFRLLGVRRVAASSRRSSSTSSPAAAVTPAPASSWASPRGRRSAARRRSRLPRSAGAVLGRVRAASARPFPRLVDLVAAATSCSSISSTPAFPGRPPRPLARALRLAQPLAELADLGLLEVSGRPERSIARSASERRNASCSSAMRSSAERPSTASSLPVTSRSFAADAFAAPSAASARAVAIVSRSRRSAVSASPLMTLALTSPTISAPPTGFLDAASARRRGR